MGTPSSCTAFVDLNLQNLEEKLDQSLVEHRFCCVPKNDVLKCVWKDLSAML